MSSYAPPRYSLLAAPVSGLSARAIIAWLPRDVVEERTAGLPPKDRAEVLATYDAIRAAAEASAAEQQHEDHPPSPLSSVPSVPAEVVPVEEAARMIGRSSRRVRQLLDEGRLSGEKRYRGCWSVHLDSVEDYLLALNVAQAS